MEYQCETRDNSVYITRRDSVLDGFWILELIEIDELFLIDPDGVDSKVVVPVAKDLFNLGILQPD
jgi:hypothetical protein